MSGHQWPDNAPTPWLWGRPAGPCARVRHADYLERLRASGLVVPAELAAPECRCWLRHWSHVLDLTDGNRLYGLESMDRRCAMRLVVETQGPEVVGVYVPRDWPWLKWYSPQPRAVMDERWKQDYWRKVKEQQTCNPSR